MRSLILAYDFKINEHDKCLYIDYGYVTLCFLIFGAYIEIVNVVKKYLSKKFDMKDLGEAHIVLGMQIERTLEGIYVSQ